MNRFTITAIAVACFGSFASADITVLIESNDNDNAVSTFAFENVPKPSPDDAASVATLKVLRGDRDSNGAGLDCLIDGELAADQDAPAQSFFFAASRPGQILLDLGERREIDQINTYSWHSDVRAPQVYTIFGIDSETLENVSTTDLETKWTKVAAVDTRDTVKTVGGQVGVSIRDDAEGEIGSYRYLLFDVAATGDSPFGQTFFTEIDVVDGKKYVPTRPAKPVRQVETLAIGDDYVIQFDVTEVPAIQPWVTTVLMPVCETWYPKIVGLFPSENFSAIKKFTVFFEKDMDGVAYANGRDIHCAERWFMANLEGEATGSVVHEMVHIVQQYRGRRDQKPNPGWLVEGVADYVRWHLYEAPENRRKIDPQRAKVTDSYQTTGAFLAYVVENHDAKFVEKLNAAMRNGQYDDAIWTDNTDHTIDALWAMFIKTL